MTATVAAQQQAILSAALDLLAEGGPQALRVRDIAAAAGCTTMTVYSRFGGKDGLVEAIYVDGFQRFADALAEAATRPIDEALLHMGMAYRRWALDNPGSYQVMFTEVVPGFAPSEEAGLVALTSFQHLVDMVTAQQEAGVLRVGDPHEIAWTQWGLTHGLVMLELAGIKPPTEPLEAEQIYLKAVRASIRAFTPE